MKISSKEFTFKNLNPRDYPRESVKLEQTELSKYWLTPGLFMANQIVKNPLVRFIGDRMYPDYSQTLILIEDDPEELLNKIFSVEQTMYEKFKGLRFDLRVQVIKKDFDMAAIKNSYITYYNRDLTKNNA